MGAGRAPPPPLFLFLLLLVLAAGAAARWVATPETVRPRLLREQVLWVSGGGAGGGPPFSRGGSPVPPGPGGGPHLPGAAAGRPPGGALLACAEGRKRSAADVGAKIIACRRSPDRGATWGPTQVVADDGWGGDGLSLGALAVAGGGEVLLLFARCAHPPQACGPPSTLLLRSPDGGRSWGPPQNLSDVVGGEVFAPGPGSGIQKQLPPFPGRLVFCGHGTLESSCPVPGPAGVLWARHPGADGVSLLLSDDGGHSWHRGGVLPAIPLRGPPAPPTTSPPDECQPFELPDGSIAVSIRNQGSYRCRCRMRARSWDGGESLSPASVTLEPQLPDPAVAAGALALPQHGLVLFSNPAHETERVNLTLRWSFDNGTTWWGRGLRVWDGPSGYSVLAAPPPEEEDPAPLVYLIYEKGRSLSTETVSLATISLSGDL
ncbi:sialidase-1 [Haemorhous mexicanus]|uniref:sialidase-1 n=1 Tax=Haemorhous mexicanus TaxID=30427 RepID=UPI0028BDD588|nr:sialidase-1 [Haemorhous mexicanus]